VNGLTAFQCFILCIPFFFVVLEQNKNIYNLSFSIYSSLFTTHATIVFTEISKKYMYLIPFSPAFIFCHNIWQSTRMIEMGGTLLTLQPPPSPYRSHCLNSPTHLWTPSTMGSNNPHMRIVYTPMIANDPTAQAVNQITALLERADALLRHISSSPDFNSQSILAFFSQPGRAQWMLLIQRDGISAGVASGPTVPQCSSDSLRGLTKQVQAISSKLGAIQAQLQKPDKTYA
jgi:hypothetical protein